MFSAATEFWTSVGWLLMSASAIVTVGVVVHGIATRLRRRQKTRHREMAPGAMTRT
jgi:hypothetical protein